MIKYLKIKPCQSLLPYIESIWIQENDTLSTHNRNECTTVLPTTMIDMVFHYGDYFVQQKSDRDVILPKINLTGQKTTPTRLKATGKTGIIIVSFKPWGFFHLFRIPVNEFKNLSVDLTDILNYKKVNYLEERFTEAQSVKAKVDIVQSFLCDIAAKVDKYNADKLIIAAAFKIFENEGTKNITEIRESYFISKRNFIRRFQKVIGSNPKEFSNVIRFQKALQYAKFEVPIEKIITTLGYYDQSHLLRELKKLGGYSRSKIIKKCSTSPLKKTFNSEYNMAHFYNTIYL